MLVLTRDLVTALTRTRRGLVSELELTAVQDGVPSDCFVNFDNVHTLPRTAFRRRITRLSAVGLHQACRTLRASTGC
ncbi:putative toxin MazF2 [Mycobacterium xenopi 4042]|uniref:Putative toxin MazF2 n=1 Tax=Mycobacterium xenopi 4042 TaxID=1299334 RepID=X8C8A8_MYCXE|nr:putative toxin MazF2 [Mycobacterium xenopi 4042]